MKKKLGLFHPAFEGVGGAELLVAAQARYYQDQGVNPEVVTLGMDLDRWAARLSGIPVHLVPKRKWTDVFGGFGRLGKLQFRGRRAAEYLRGFDLVIAHNHPCSTMLGAARIPGKKVWQCNEPYRTLHLKEANPTLTRRHLGPASPEPGEALKAFGDAMDRYTQGMSRDASLRERYTHDIQAIQGIHLIYAISEFSRDNARRIYGRCREEVIYPIVRFPEGGRNRAGLDRTVRRVLVHSRLEALKNIDTVIRGFARFQAASPVPCELHVVGDGPMRQRLESLAMSLCPAGAVRFYGYLPDAELREVYEACDVFALLTLDEPFGMVYPEAAAKGLLMVGPDHGGPLEILDGGRLGWVVDAFSPAALAEALLEVWRLDDGEVDRRREAADRACRSRYGLEAIGPQLMALLAES